MNQSSLMPSTRNAAKPRDTPKNDDQTGRTTRNSKKQIVEEPLPIKRTRGQKEDEKTKPAEDSKKNKTNKKEQQKPELEEKPKTGKKGRTSKKDDEQEQASNKKDETSKQTESKAQPKSEADPEEKDEKQLKKLVLKGTVPVDEYFSKPAQYKIYSDGDRTYAATLNQSNIEANNNKFYIIQLLQHQTTPNEFSLFTRWGRVGVQGQHSENVYKSRDAAIKDYNKKFNEKKKTYKEVEMNYEENAQEEKQQPKKEGPASTLAPPVQDLIRLIFDMGMMAKQMKAIGYDANKMPLGKLAKSSILKGYTILQEIMNEIKGRNRREVINQLTGNFYSQIPHNFGFEKMQNFVLDTEKKVKDKLQMLQSLEDIQVFTKLLDEGSLNSDINTLDSNYLKLNTTITPLDKNSPTYQLLLEYVTNTHASTHTAYKLQVEEIFELAKQEEIARYKQEINNKQLLWHGSRLTNFVGILSQGLRIAPPEAPVTGYMFGKGVYFADMVTKSANYCFASRQNSTGLMLLCEVALGDCNEKFYADYYANLLPEGKKSTKGCGKTAPKEGKMLGDVLVPCGQGVSTGIQNSSLLYNEFIVYDVAQIKCRYLFKMRFIYS